MNAHAIRKDLEGIQGAKSLLVAQGHGGSPTYRAALRLQYEELMCRENELVMQAAELLDWHKKEVRALLEILGGNDEEGV